MYPDKEVISYSDNLLGITPLYALFRLTGFDFLTSFQLLIILCHILNFTFCFFCFYKLIDNKYAAACGAFIFAFSIILDGIHNHPQYTFRFCIPLFFYFLYNYLNTFSFKYLFYSAVFLALQFYLGVYLGYFLLIISIAFVFCHFLFNYPNLINFKKFGRQSLQAVPVLAIPLIPLFYFYYKRSQITGYYTDYDFYMQTIPRLSSYFKSFPGSITWSFLTNTNVNSKYEWVHILFPGILIFISIIMSVYLIFKGENKKLYLTLLLTLFIFILFTINYNGHTLYGYLMKIPGIKAARVVSRVVTVLIFFGGWLVCLNISYLQIKFSKYSKVLIIVLPVILFFDNYCFPHEFKTFDKKECRSRINIIKQKISVRSPYKAFAYIPKLEGAEVENAPHYHIDAMLCALELKWKTVNGYSSSAHKLYGPFWRKIDSTSLANWCTNMNLSIDSVLLVH